MRPGRTAQAVFSFGAQKKFGCAAFCGRAADSLNPFYFATKLRLAPQFFCSKQSQANSEIV
jgi:hypothetical protein